MMDFKNLIALDKEHVTATDAREHLELTREWALMFAAIGALAMLFACGASLAATLSAPLLVLVPLLVGFGFAAVIALVVLRSLEYARHTLATILYEWQQNQETMREVARTVAEQQTTVNVKGKSNIVSVNSGAPTVEQVRLVGVNVNTPRRALDGVDERDLLYFCERAVIAGHSKRVWLGQTLPSGKLVSTFQDYDQMIAPLLKAGLIVGRGERSAGKLVTDDAGELKRALGLPSGAYGAPQQEVKEIGEQNQIAQSTRGYKIIGDD